MTLRDPRLPHQVVFSVTGGHGPVTISCNCRLQHGGSYAPIGPTRNLDESRVLYDNPANHWRSFGDDDKARW